jgi:hypothetical protein
MPGVAYPARFEAVEEEAEAAKAANEVEEEAAS